MQIYPPAMSLQDLEHELPAGFRFCPSDEELVCYYLYNKVYNQEDSRETWLLEVDLHTCEPWQLPDTWAEPGFVLTGQVQNELGRRCSYKTLYIIALGKGWGNRGVALSQFHTICLFIYSLKSFLGENLNTTQFQDIVKINSEEWYFFSFRDRKYAMGCRINRATPSGYWKATGRDRAVVAPRSGKIVGMRKTLVFHRNRAPNGIKTGWIMHEFRLENATLASKEDWVLCRVIHKSKGESSNHIHPHRMHNLESPLTSDHHLGVPQHFASLDFPAPDPGFFHPSISNCDGDKLNETESGQDLGFLLDGSMEGMMPFDLDTSQILL